MWTIPGTPMPDEIPPDPYAPEYEHIPCTQPVGGMDSEFENYGGEEDGYCQCVISHSA
jgi:hypothetical protein